MQNLFWFAVQLVDPPKFTWGSRKHTLIAAAALALPVIVCFSWLYYREWKLKRNFKKYWEGKGRGPVE
jgi:hypothetical protein